MRILITGASGLLGLNLALEATQNHHVFGCVNQHSIQTDAFEVIQADLLAPGAVEHVLNVSQPDWIIHCAALANLETCEASPALAEQLNSWLPAKLAQLVTRGGARLLHISTDAVFDGQRGNYLEEDLPDPQSVYAHTKLHGEQAVAQVNPQAIIARVNFYGWSLSGQRSLGEFFYNNLSKGVQVPGFTDVFFCPLLVNDLAKILLDMLQAQLSGLYHVVSSQAISKYDFGRMLADVFQIDPSLIAPTSVQQVGLKAPRSRILTLETAKISHALGQTMPDVNSGMQHFYQLFKTGYPARLQSMQTPTSQSPG